MRQLRGVSAFQDNAKRRRTTPPATVEIKHRSTNSRVTACQPADSAGRIYATMKFLKFLAPEKEFKEAA
jgi:hypothetical protein